MSRRDPVRHELRHNQSEGLPRREMQVSDFFPLVTVETPIDFRPIDMPSALQYSNYTWGGFRRVIERCPGPDTRSAIGNLPRP